MKIKKSLYTLGAVVAAASPIAAVVSCGTSTEEKAAVGMIVTSDGTINDGFFSPMWHAISSGALSNGEKAAYVDVSQKQKQATIDAANSLVENGAKVVFQPGFKNSETLIENAVAHPNVKFIGAAYSRYIASVKAFTDVAHHDANDAAFTSHKNIGLVHFKTQEQGFMMGYLSAHKYFTENASETSVKFSVVAAANYQDTTAMLDGYMAGVRAYAGTTKTATFVAPTASGVFTNKTVESADFNSSMQAAVSKLTSEGVKLVFIADPNAIGVFTNHRFILAADGADWGSRYADVAVATDKNWSNIFATATAKALHKNAEFVAEYHDKMHLSSFANNELLLEPTQHYAATATAAAAAKTAAENALKAWETKLTTNNSDVRNIYAASNDKGEETNTTQTSGGRQWVADLAPVA